MSRDSMIFYRSFYESLKDLPTEVKAEVYDAIFSYSLDFEIPILNGISNSIFILIKPQLDANLKRYENGKKPKTKQSISKDIAKEDPAESKDVTNVNVNVNDNLNDNLNQNILLVKESKKTKNLSDRKLDFLDKLKEIIIVEDIDKNLANEFYSYWTEPNQSNTKMRFELEKTYDIARRLGTWIKNNDKFSSNKIVSNGTKETRTDSQNNAKEQFRRNFNQ